MDSEGRFYARDSGYQTAGHGPRYTAPRQCRGLGRPHGAGFDVLHRQCLELGDSASVLFHKLLAKGVGL